MAPNRDDGNLREMTRRYRYRTTVLVGSWRPSRALAIEDAVKAKQARRESREDDSISWIVPGTIEELEV